MTDARAEADNIVADWARENLPREYLISFEHGQKMFSLADSIFDAITRAELRGRIGGLREAALMAHETCAWTAKKNITDIAERLEKQK